MIKVRRMYRNQIQPYSYFFMIWGCAMTAGFLLMVVAFLAGR